MVNQSGKQNSAKEFAAALGVAFLNELNRVHHGLSMRQAALTAFLTALPLAVIVHLARGRKKQINWSYIGLFAVSFALSLLIQWQNTGHRAEFTQLLSNSFTLAVWIAAITILRTYMWQRAEGQIE